MNATAAARIPVAVGGADSEGGPPVHAGSVLIDLSSGSPEPLLAGRLLFAP